MQQVVDYLKAKLNGGSVSAAPASAGSANSAESASIEVAELAPAASFTPVVEPVSENAPSLSVLVESLPAAQSAADVQKTQIHVLLVDDGSELAVECKNQLLSEGVSVYILQWPQQFVASANSFDVPLLSLSAWDETTIKTELEAFLSHNSINSLLVLQPQLDAFDQESGKAIYTSQFHVGEAYAQGFGASSNTVCTFKLY